MYTDELGALTPQGLSGYADRQPLEIPSTASGRACFCVAGVCHLGRMHRRPWGRRRWAPPRKSWPGRTRSRSSSRSSRPGMPAQSTGRRCRCAVPAPCMVLLRACELHRCGLHPAGCKVLDFASCSPFVEREQGEHVNSGCGDMAVLRRRSWCGALLAGTSAQRPRFLAVRRSPLTSKQAACSTWPPMRTYWAGRSWAGAPGCDSARACLMFLRIQVREQLNCQVL